jgi:hypothetical protein
MRIYLDNNIYNFITNLKRDKSLEIELRFGKKIDRDFITNITEKQFNDIDSYLSKKFNSKKSSSVVEIYTFGREKIRKIIENGKITIERKKKIYHHDLDFLDFSLRLALSSEELLENFDINLLRNPSEIRNRERKEYITRDFNYVLTKIVKDSSIFYEFEIEFNIISVNIPILLGSINEILPILVDEKNSGFSYLNIGEQEFIRRSFKRLGIREAKPKGLQRRETPFLQKEGYSVTNKLDGERFIIFFSNSGIYSINDRIVDKLFENTFQRPSVLDSEFFQGKFYIFDCMISNGVNITMNPHIQRVEYGRNVSKNFTNILIMKEFSTDLLQRTKYLLQNLDKNINDGLIYTPNKEYNSDKIYKWKFPEKITIDFLVKKFNYGKFQKNVIQNNPYYQYFLTVPSSYYSCLMPWHVEQVESIILDWFDKTELETIVDATANIGVDSIFFSKIYDNSRIYSYEIDPLTFGALVQNVKRYNADNIKVFNDSSINLLKNKGTNYDLVYIDAPWGGKDYYKLKNIDLYLQAEDDLIKDEYKNLITFARYLYYYNVAKNIVLKVPYNFNFEELGKYFDYDRKNVYSEKNKDEPSFVLVKLSPKTLNIKEEYPQNLLENIENIENNLQNLENIYQLFCKGEENSLIPFTGNDRYPLSVSLYFDNVQRLRENGIYEFGYENNSKEFVLFRERPDKLSPNFYKVAKNIWNDIKNPFTENELVKLLSPKVLEKYRKYHNVIKKEIIIEYCKNKVILDLGVGRGGDIDKYRDAGIEFLYGVEPDKENYDEFLRRLSESPLSSKTKLIVGKAQDTEKILEKIGHKYDIDIISSFFSLSFFFFKDSNKKYKDLEELIKTIDENLKYGGYFIGTTIDGEKTRNLLDSMEKFDFDGGYMRFLDKNEGIVEIVISETIVRTQIESLVDFELLVNKLREKNIFLVKSEFFRENKDLTESENILNSLYRSFIFRRESCEEIITRDINKILAKSKDTFFNRLSQVTNDKCIEIFNKLCIIPDNLTKYETRIGFSYPLVINFPKIKNLSLRAKVNKPGNIYNVMREFYYGYKYVNKLKIPNFVKTYSLVNINDDKKMLITENVINSTPLYYFISKDLPLYDEKMQYKIILSIISQIYSSLLILEERGLYHGDITNANILIQRNKNISSISYGEMVNLKIDVVENLVVRIIDYEVMTAEKDMKNVDNCYKKVRNNFSIQKDFILKDLLFPGKNPYPILEWVKDIKPSNLRDSFVNIYSVLEDSVGYKEYIYDIIKFI